jgi:hypothetical protein
VAAAETISQESADPYAAYYAYTQTLPAIVQEED